jgi:hypothetical protein
LAADPCRLARQVKEFDRLPGEIKSFSLVFLFDPCRLARQVKKFARLEVWERDQPL